MRRFNAVTIIGVGLIGGSIGLAVKKRGLAKEVVGVFRRASTKARALRRRAVDRGCFDLESGVRDADLIVVAAPVRAIPGLAIAASRAAKPGAIITDAGSTKRWIVGAIEKALGDSPSVSFVGSHPMAGSEQTSVDHARSDLFQGAACIVTKTARTSPAAVRDVARFWRALGARAAIMSPASHDARVSMVSHLPHLVAFSLAGAVGAKDLTYAAEGFKDTSRVASSDPELWADIFMTNRRDLLAAAAAFSRSLADIRAAVSRGDRGALVSILRRAKMKRDRYIAGSDE